MDEDEFSFVDWSRRYCQAIWFFQKMTTGFPVSTAREDPKVARCGEWDMRTGCRLVKR